MDTTIENHANVQAYRLGKMNNDQFWLQCPDGRMLLLDQNTKNVLEKLASNEQAITTIAQQLNIEEDDIVSLFDMLNLHTDTTFILIDESDESSQTKTGAPLEGQEYSNKKQFTTRYGTLCIAIALSLSLVAIITFLLTTPFQFVSGFKAQWIIASLLTVSVIIHEIGHLLAMPRSRNISISVQWTGPIPLLSITCNEAWKLSKWQRMRINLAGLIADLVVCGTVAGIGLLFGNLAPWIWSFLFVHLLRMIFAIWPLLPGDGYWVLVDLFDKPNLWNNALTQLKQWRLNWLSLYALGRNLFLGLIWLLYAYIIYIWTMRMIYVPIKEAITFFLHPAPLLVFLNVLNQVFSVSSWAVKKIVRSKPSSSNQNVN